MNHHLCYRLGQLLAVLVIPLLVVSSLPPAAAPLYAQEEPAPETAELGHNRLALPAVFAPEAPKPVALSDPVTLSEPVISSETEVACGPDAPGPPGQKVVLQAEEELDIGWRLSGDRSLKMTNMNLIGTTLSPDTQTTSGGGFSNVSWVATTFADLSNTDGSKKNLVAAFRDAYNRIAVVSDVTQTSEWYLEGGAYDGEVAYIDIAAGDLDRGTYPFDEEVVVAFRDDNLDLHVIALENKNTTAGIAQSPNSHWGQYWDNADGRGNVAFVTVETGDFNGDGFRDEIVAVFKDSNNDLQAVVLRRDGTALTRLWWKAWQIEARGDVALDSWLWRNSNRPIAVTTGDVDGDQHDEIIAAFRVGPSDDGSVQLLVLDPTVDTKGTSVLTDDVYSFDDRVTINHPLTDYAYMAALSVSVSAGDLDGDGVDEIAVGYGSLNKTDVSAPRYWRHFVTSYEYVPQIDPAWTGCLDPTGKLRACLQQRTGKWGGPRVAVDSNFEGSFNIVVTIDAGDLDGDDLDEVALVRQEWDTGDLLTYVWNAEDAISSPVITHRTDTRTEGAEDFWMAIGDHDGDGTYGTYTGVCNVKKSAQIQAVLHAPPHWPWTEPYSNAEFVEAGYGVSVGSTRGGGQTATSTIGGTMETELAFHGVGPVFSRDVEYSWSVTHETLTTTVESKHTTTVTPHDSATEYSYDLIVLAETFHWCYDYTEPSLGLIPVCLPYPTTSMSSVAYSLRNWYTSGAATYAETWVPVGRNLAKGITATQSSDYKASTTAVKAVDGNINGDYWAGSVSHTNYQAQPYWQVDLGGRQWINAALLWNRTDSSGERLASAYVFVSEKPFASTNPDVLKADTANVWTAQLPATTPERRTIVPVNRYGRYVRVQLPGSNYLQLAELEIYGMPATPKDWPVLAPVKNTPAAGQYRLQWSDDHTQDVTGDVKFISTGTALGVRVDSEVMDMATGAGQESDFIQEGETANSRSVGIKVKGKKIEYTSGSSVINSASMGWSSEIEFSGAVDGLPAEAPASMEYNVQPYVWLQRNVSRDGTDQAFLVLDWWTPPIPESALAEAAAAPVVPSGPAVVPLTPQISSASHPNPGTWYDNQDAEFTWAQPDGDPATITGYRWAIDHAADTVLPPASTGNVTAATYEGLADGVWYLHVRAEGAGNQWSDTAHRKIQVDTTAPQVSLALDPPLPTGNNGWYITPVNAVVTTTDGAGSGVAKIETSPDGATWQTYSGPIPFGSDTPGATVYARATDLFGHVSSPVSLDFKIDRTPPDSHVAGGEGPGALVARVLTGPEGNQVLVMAGEVQDALSGRAGMHLGIDGGDWTSAKEVGTWPGVQANWTFTATRELGAGNHIFMGDAQDGAGNTETPYEIAQVLWLPQASPNLDGSSIAVSPSVVRPGEVISITLVARNGGFQEALVQISDVIPASMSVVTETLAADATYDPSSRTLNFPPDLLWPGEWAQRTFQARAETGLPESELEIVATFHAFWPNTDSLPEADRQRFVDREQTAVKTAVVGIDPALPTNTDATPPWAVLTIATPEGERGGPSTVLAVRAAEDVRWMFLREWTADPVSGAWTVAQSSGWIEYRQAFDWTLSAGHGVKYLGIWVRDAAGNLSTLDEGSLAFANRWDGNQSLAAEERVQFRGRLPQGSLVAGLLTTVRGDPDLFAWRPDNGFLPNLISNASVPAGETEQLGEQMVQRIGVFLVEVHAAGASEYQISFIGSGPDAAAAQAAALKPLPKHPLTVSDPLSAGVAGHPEETPVEWIRVPLLFNSR